MRIGGFVAGGEGSDVLDGGDKGVGLQVAGEGGFVVESGCGTNQLDVLMVGGREGNTIIAANDNSQGLLFSHSVENAGYGSETLNSVELRRTLRSEQM